MAEQYSSTLMEMMKQLPSITIPPLQISFPWRRHPLTPQLQLSCDAWILAHFSHLPSTTKPSGLLFTADELLGPGLPLFGSLVHARAPFSRIEPAVKFMAWFFVIDSVIDDPNEMGADAAAADALINCIANVLDQPAYSYPGNNPVIKALVESAQDWWYTMRQGMPPCQKARFIAFFKEYMESSRLQIVFRTSDAVPQLDTFKKIRFVAGGWSPCSVLIEYVYSIELDEETLMHPLVVALSAVTAYNLYWVNDLCSFKKELLENDCMNLVPVLYNHNVKQLQKKDVSLESVVGEVCAMIKANDDECVRLMAEIRASKLLMSKVGMAEYVEGLEDWLGGNLYWELVSGRYGVGASDDMYNCAPETAVHYKVSIKDAQPVPMHSN